MHILTITQLPILQIYLGHLVSISFQQIVSNNNTCWYRIDLSHAPIDLSEEIASAAAVVTGGNDKQNEQMHKAVMKRLLGDKSPTSSTKRKCILRMCDGDNATHTTINLLVEMGATVDEAKDMIINNYDSD